MPRSEAATEKRVEFCSSIVSASVVDTLPAKWIEDDKVVMDLVLNWLGTHGLARWPGRVLHCFAFVPV